jgi:hypothetical protein
MENSLEMTAPAPPALSRISPGARKPAAILIACCVLLAGAAFWFARIEPPRVSLQFVGYRWSPGDAIWNADFRLTNGTPRAVKYVSADAPLERIKPAPTMIFRRASDRPWNGFHWGKLVYRIREYDLAPGESVSCSIPVDPGTPAMNAGALCNDPMTLPRSQVMHRLNIWWLSIKARLKIRTTPPGQIWCKEVLLLPESAQLGPAK